MFIQTENTPNPATLKFLPGQTVMGEGAVADFPSVEQAARSPLALRLIKPQQDQPQHRPVLGVLHGPVPIGGVHRRPVELVPAPFPQFLGIFGDFQLQGFGHPGVPVREDDPATFLGVASPRHDGAPQCLGFDSACL
mgnify:CR=1 FL=1